MLWVRVYNGFSIKEIVQIYLKELSLDRNAIVDVPPLANLTHLKELSLNLNSISDISPLTVLTQLSWLVIVGNPLKDDTFNVVSDMRVNGTKVIVEPILEN